MTRNFNRHHRQQSRKARKSKNTNLQYQSLEPRQLLVGDISVAAASFQPAAINDVFSYDAVTVEQMIERSEHRPYAANELIVAVELNQPKLEAAAGLAALNWELMIGNDQVEPIRTLMTIDTTANHSVSLVHLDLGTDADLFSAMYELDERVNVLWSSPNFYQLESPIEFVPNDPEYGSQYHHPLMQNDLAWDLTLGDPSIVIGITDDGVETTHVDLAANIWSNTGEIAGNGIDDDGNGYIDDVEGWDFANDNNTPDPDQLSHDHGTHVAGIAAGVTNNAIGTAGTAGNATIMPLQFYKYDSGAWTAAVINESFVYGIDNGAHIISTSYNMDGWAGDPVVTAGYQYIYDNGGIHFNSAGNGNSLNTPRIVFEQSLMVVSTDSADLRSSFSNYGDGVDISAPGSSIYATVTDNLYGTKSGTSMSTPNAAGVAALIWSQNPTWTRDQVVAQLLGTADDIDALNPGFEGWLGSGRVNSFQALTATLAAPQVLDLINLPGNGAVTNDLTIDSFQVKFDQYLDPTTANNLANYELVTAGADGLFDTADDQTIALTKVNNYMAGSNTVRFETSGGPLGIGEYRLTLVSGGLENPFGTELDGDGDTVGGDDHEHYFSILPPPPVALNPRGSAAFEQQVPGSFSSAGEVDVYFIELDANQSLSVAVTSSSAVDPQITIKDPGGTTIGTMAGVGNAAALNSAPVSMSGNYVISVESGNGSTDGYTMQLLINAGFEQEGLGGGDNDTSGNAEDINSAALNFAGTGERMAVVGQLPSSIGNEVYGDNFETGSLGSAWTTSVSDPLGRIELTSAWGAAVGTNAMAMDVNAAGTYSLQEAVWTVDLSSVSNPTLAFWHAEYNDEEDVLPASFTGSQNGDGVAISDDGVNWYTILNAPNTAAGLWTQEVFDLNSLATTHGLTLGANFQIKFQHYDNYNLSTDGRLYDNVQILTPNPGNDWYQFDLDDGQVATIAAAPHTLGETVSVELYDDGLNLIQAGVPGQNVGSVVQQYTDTTSDGGADTYYVKVAGTNTRYTLVVTRDADFDLEPNDDEFTPQNIDAVEGVFGYVSNAEVVNAEPDNFAPGTIISNLFPGVTLSNNVTAEDVYAEDAGFGAPTGSNVFAPGLDEPQGWSDDTDELRADFAEPQQFVSIDVGSDDASDIGFLRAYNSSGTLLAEVISSALPSGASETLSILRPSADISYIIAAGLGGDITPLDNLTFEVQGSGDQYEFNATVGENIQFSAYLPGVGPFFTDNGLDNGSGSDLVLELYDPNGVLVATGSEALSHTALENGAYQIAVSTSNGRGEYYLYRDPGVTPPVGIDFGPSDAPVWPTYAGVFDDAYDPGVGYGWLGSPTGLLPLEGNRGNDLTRDKVNLRNGTFVIDVPNGTYNVDVFLGPVRKTDAIRITVEGNEDTFTPLAGPNVTRSYVTTVADGQLTFDFDGLAGLDNRIRIAGIGLQQAAGRFAPLPGGKQGITARAGGWADHYRQSVSPTDQWFVSDSKTESGQANPIRVELPLLTANAVAISNRPVDIDQVFANHDDVPVSVDDLLVDAAVDGLARRSVSAR